MSQRVEQQRRSKENEIASEVKVFKLRGPPPPGKRMVKVEEDEETETKAFTEIEF